MVRHVLTGQHGYRIAVILNEFGEDTGIESSFIQDQQVCGSCAVYTVRHHHTCLPYPTVDVAHARGAAHSRDGPRALLAAAPMCCCPALCRTA